MKPKILFKSFRYGLQGLRWAWQHEQNFRIELFIFVLVILAALYFNLPAWQWIVLLLVTGMVLVMELINTIFERTIDVIQPRIHHYAEQAKNVMAAAVLLATVGAVVIGLIIFVPHIAAKLSS